jgi:SagB-type dehydrogenase family enzyme
VMFLVLCALSAPAQEVVKLPTPDLKANASFAEVVNTAKTMAAISNDPLPLADLSYILWIAGGRTFTVDTVSGASRAYPSAFNSYPIRLYVLAGNVTGLKAGIYQYVVEDHGLKLLVTGDQRATSIKGAGYAGSVAFQPATIVLAADTAKYGTGDRQRWLQQELGALAEVVSLTAASRGRAINIVSEVDPAKAKALFKSQDDPLLFLPIGKQ